MSHVSFLRHFCFFLSAGEAVLDGVVHLVANSDHAPVSCKEALVALEPP